LTLGLGIVGLGVFRYQQVAALEREGARYAAVHGGQWATDNHSGTLTTPTDICNNAIFPHASGLSTGTDPSTSQLATSDVTVTWADSGQMPSYTVTVSGTTTTYTNIVTVTVNYRWAPAAYLPAMTLTSTAKMPISY